MLVKEIAALLALGLTVGQLVACGDDDKKKNRDHGQGVDHGRDGDPDGDEASEGFRDLDAGITTGASDGGALDAAPVVRCDVTHRELGCGTGAPDAGWVRFDRGAQVDTRTGSGWVSVTLTDAELRNTDPDDALEKKCKALVVPGLGKLRIPEIEDVRTWAAGCAKTEAAGSCTITTDRANAAEAEGCRCDPPVARGPHTSGGFCRPEVAECETLWVTTFCHPHDCTSHTHWFYDVSTGSVVLGDYKSDIARRARSYCVSDQPITL
ncbi:MAG: hypothetical protein ABW252_10390 [Polyangiales bacterium]